MKKSKKYLANCLCGGIKVKIQGNLRYVSNCHCSQCMQTHGNFAAYTSCMSKDLTFLNKSSLRWYKSSNNAKRGFCNKCGASIFFKRKDNPNISISAGMFQKTTKLTTKNHIFTKGKMNYYKLDNKLPKYHRYHK